MASRSAVREVIADLQRRGSPAVRNGMARFAIPSNHAVGIPVGTLRGIAKSLGRDHDLAVALWQHGLYEARMLACFVDDPKLVTPAQMDRWCRDFDSWAICDTACFHLFDKTPYAYRKVEQWVTKKAEFVKRAAFALLASLALHDKKGPDQPFIDAMPLIEEAATDERNFVRKGVSWALRGIGMRNENLRAIARVLAEKLAASEDKTERWIGKDALKDFKKPVRSRKSTSR
jgi:3-methyladenine DNA glycosylase AlkD